MRSTGSFHWMKSVAEATIIAHWNTLMKVYRCRWNVKWIHRELGSISIVRYNWIKKSAGSNTMCRLISVFFLCVCVWVPIYSITLSFYFVRFDECWKRHSRVNNPIKKIPRATRKYSYHRLPLIPIIPKLNLIQMWLYWIFNMISFIFLSTGATYDFAFILSSTSKRNDNFI